MRVLVDGTHLTPLMKGVGRYVSNILARLPALDPDISISVAVSDGLPPGILPGHPRLAPVRVAWRNHLWHGYATMPGLVRKLAPDVVWSPQENPLDPGPAPFVMSCHGIPPILRGIQGPRHGPWAAIEAAFRRLDERLMLRALGAASVVFANSACVAAWLGHGAGVRAERVRLAPCAPGFDFGALGAQADAAGVRARLGAPEGYILAFYTGDPWDNLDAVLRVYDRVARMGLRQSLVVAGLREGDFAEVAAAAGRYPWAARLKSVGFLDETQAVDLAGLYAAAAAYLDPSLHEGFGMQVVEAMSCGTPVVCSDRGALPEVAGDAAVLAGPDDIEGMAEALRRLLADPEWRELRAASGRRQAARYGWGRTAEAILGGLRSAAG